MGQALNVLIPSHNLLIQFHIHSILFCRQIIRSLYIHI
jgi:hypothetical protein